MKKIIILILFSVFSQVVYSQTLLGALSPRDEYFLLLSDLINANANTNGYKSNLYVNENTHISIATRNINFSQGSPKKTNRELDFAIIGEGFFKIILDNGNIAYTRNGEFTINEKTKEIVTIKNDYKLFNTFKIEPGYTKLLLKEDNSIITIYPDGKEINNGILNIYNLNTKKLKSIDNNNVIFIYNGDEENIGNGKIFHKFIELSNVMIVATMVRLIVIERKLGMKFEYNLN